MNSKKLAIVVILGLLALGGAGFGLYLKKMDSKGFRGIGLSVKGVERETVEDWIAAFETVLQKEEVLQAIVDDCDYVAMLEVSESEAIEHLRGAVHVNFSSSRKTIQVGLMGKRKNNVKLDEISQKIFNVAAPSVAALKPAFGAHYQRLSELGQ